MAEENGSKNWITLSYKDLVDNEAITRTGQKLQEAMAGNAPKAVLQPFLDGFSSLLPYAVEMIYGPDPVVQNNIVNRYLVGLGQPAWVGILRGGRILITTDDRGHARVFLRGEDPNKAFQENYPVIRHCLNRLLPPNGAHLNLEVFAYQNDYQKAELRLNLKPYLLSRSSFPSRKQSLDLGGLTMFLSAGGRLEGAELNRREGLILYANQAGKQILAGSPLSISDLAVAYRAVFHAGDNEPFISLDAHRDPLMATVNFGGYLENTHIGSVILEADKRFKTISCGLDPNSYEDVRARVRERVPSFLTSAERGFLDGALDSTNVWIATRCWFYPNSVSVDTDKEQRFAVITNAQFTAEAERLEPGMTAPRKQASLAPEVRQNINHLNKNYKQYAEAFPELSELNAVARLMAICTWLRKANPDWLDLDELLAVDLRPFTTPRECPKLVVTAFVTAASAETLNQDYIARNSKVIRLNPTLDRTIEESFQDAVDVAEFLSLKSGQEKTAKEEREREAMTLFASKKKKVRDLIRSSGDLVAFLNFVSRKIKYPEPASIARNQPEINGDKEKMEKLQADMSRVKAKMDRSAGKPSPGLTAEYARLESQYQELMKKHHDRDQLPLYRYRSLFEVTGGINLKPDNFNVKTNAVNPALRRLMEISQRSGGTWTMVQGSVGQWMRSGSLEAASRLATLPPPPGSAPGTGRGQETVKAPPAGKTIPSSRPKIIPPQQRPPAKPEIEISQVYRQRLPETKQQKIKLSKGAGPGTSTGIVVGELSNDGRIVFKRPSR